MNQTIFENLPRKMNLISDLFSRVVFRDKEACHDLVRIILGEGYEVTEVTSQYDITNLQYRSVVLDILAETAGEEPIHVEFQISDDDDHMRRVRYCNGSIDTHLLKKGKSYKELPDVYHIYITMNDFIGGGQTVYEIFRTVRDREETYSTQYPVGNGVHELYINLEIPLDDGSELDHLLRYDQVVYDGNSTFITPDSGDTSGSRQTLVTGEACRRACLLLRDAMEYRSLSDLNGQEFYGEYYAKTNPLGANVPNPVSHVAYGYATQMCILDKETGKIKKMVAAHDVGKAINPLSCEGQIEGGVVMSMGYALTEQYPLDARQAHRQNTARSACSARIRSPRSRRSSSTSRD